MIVYKFPNGLVLKLPEQILIIQGTKSIKEGTHYCLFQSKTWSGEPCFNISHKNGIDVSLDKMYLYVETILNMKYEACSLERYFNSRVFL